LLFGSELTRNLNLYRWDSFFKGFADILHHPHISTTHIPDVGCHFFDEIFVNLRRHNFPEGIIADVDDRFHQVILKALDVHLLLFASLSHGLHHDVLGFLAGRFQQCFLLGLATYVGLIGNFFDFLIKVDQALVEFLQALLSIHLIALQCCPEGSFLNCPFLCTHGHRFENQEVQDHRQNQEIENLPDDGAKVNIKHGLAPKKTCDQRVGKQHYQHNQQHVN